MQTGSQSYRPMLSWTCKLCVCRSTSPLNGARYCHDGTVSQSRCPENMTAHLAPSAAMRYPLWLSIGRVPKWTKGTGCKPVGVSLRRFESSRAHSREPASAGSFFFTTGCTQLGRPRRSGRRGRSFESSQPTSSLKSPLRRLRRMVFSKNHLGHAQMCVAQHAAQKGRSSWSCRLSHGYI